MIYNDSKCMEYFLNFNKHVDLQKLAFTFLLGFLIVIISQISFKFVSKSINLDLTIISFPILMIFLYYFFLVSKTKFDFKTL